MLDGEGGEYPITSSSWGSSWSNGRFITYSRIRVTLQEGRKAREIRIRIQKKWFEKEVEFDFKDVELPPRF